MKPVEKQSCQVDSTDSIKGCGLKEGDIFNKNA
jgi:hypothetical protein